MRYFGKREDFDIFVCKHSKTRLHVEAQVVSAQPFEDFALLINKEF